MDDGPSKELGGAPEVKEKPSYVRRDVASRRRAGIDVEPEPCKSRGVEVRADGVIVIGDNCDKVQVEVVPAPEAPSLSIKIEHKDIPQDSDKPAEPVLRRSTQTRV